MIVVTLLFLVANIAVSSVSIETTIRTKSETLNEKKIYEAHNQLIAKHENELKKGKFVNKCEPKENRTRRGGYGTDDYPGSEGDGDIDYDQLIRWSASLASKDGKSPTLLHTPIATSNYGKEKDRNIELSETLKHWGRILSAGVGKNRREILMAMLQIPHSFNATAPELNPEIESVLTEPARALDKLLEASQNQLGAGITGLADLTLNVIYEDLNRVEIGKKLSIVLQILLDLHHQESINRRLLLMPLLDAKTWNIPKGVKKGQYLFGENVSISRHIGRSKSPKMLKKKEFFLQESHEELQENILGIIPVDAAKARPSSYAIPDRLK